MDNRDLIKISSHQKLSDTMSFVFENVEWCLRVIICMMTNWPVNFTTILKINQKISLVSNFHGNFQYLLFYESIYLFMEYFVWIKFDVLFFNKAYFWIFFVVIYLFIFIFIPPPRYIAIRQLSCSSAESLLIVDQNSYKNKSCKN